MFSLLFYSFFLMSLFWFIRTAKSILFWFYLWQLKEYHIGRFNTHFSTARGKKLILNKLLFSKVILLLCFLFSSTFLPIFFYLSDNFNFLGFLTTAMFFPSLLLFLYLIESAKAGRDFFQKKLKKPVLTKKTIPILGFTLVLFAFIPIFLWQKVEQTAFLYDYPSLHRFCFWLLLIDIFVPVIVSLIVFIFQPLTILIRNQIIKKAKKKREKFKDLLVIGITGSYGKTSTKEFLYTILSEKFYPVKSSEVGAKQFNRVNVLKTEKHQNSEIGISQCILNDLKQEHQIFICEMGAYNKGGIKLLCDIAKPKIGILTGINEQHLATFGSQENIIKTKFELIENLPEDGIAILNGDNTKIQNAKIKMQNDNVKCKDIKFYSMEEKMDVWAEDIKVYKENVYFKVYSKDGDSADFNVNLLGRQNVSNILGAACCAKELGMTLKEVSRACKRIKPIPGAMKLIKNKKGLNIIDATYSTNPDGIISHLEHLKIWRGKKVIVMPCLIELGSASKDVHQRIGKKIGEVCDLTIITTKECFKNIRNSVLLDKSCDRNKCQVDFLENPKEIFEKIEDFARKEFTNTNDVILLEGRLPKELIDLLIE